MKSESLMPESGDTKPMFWDKPEGWGGEGGGKGVQVKGTHVHLWLIHADVWQKPSQYRKVTILQLT